MKFLIHPFSSFNFVFFWHPQFVRELWPAIFGRDINIFKKLFFSRKYERIICTGFSYYINKYIILYSFYTLLILCIWPLPCSFRKSNWAYSQESANSRTLMTSPLREFLSATLFRRTLRHIVPIKHEKPLLPAFSWSVCMILS